MERANSEDVYFDSSSSQLENVGHLFETDQIFYSRHDLEKFVRDVGKENNIGIIVLHSKGGEGNGLGKAYVYFGCERSSGYRINKNTESVIGVGKRNTGTKRCNCPFRLRGKEICEGTWRLFILNGNHNHNFPMYNVGRSMMSRLSEEEKIKTKEMTQAHVPPSQILISLKNEKKDNLTTLKQMYNYRQKMRIEEMEGRSVIQQLLKYLNEESYFYSYRASSINMVTDLFFANRRVVQLLRQFYYVLIMDCTYKTNKYKMPLLQIVGCVPTGKNFIVGLAFLHDEKKDSFEWALQCTKKLFDPNYLPGVIITDREYALIHAIEGIFPTSYHMLCTRHIAKNVESRAKIDSKDQIFAAGFVRNWNRIVYAETEVDYENKLQQFNKSYARRPKLLMYVQHTWLIHAKKFVHAYTNKVLHFGNRTTNRVESAHNALKRFLKTSTGSLDTIWSRVHSFLELQENEIKASFVRSANKDLHITVLHLLTQLTGKVSHLAINKINEEYSRHEIDTNPASCGCYLRTSHGLPCAHELRLLDEQGKNIELNSIHVFWRTLHMEGTTFYPDDHRTQFQNDDEILLNYFNIMLKQSSEAKKMYISQLEKMIHPEVIVLEEPVNDRKSKGRPTGRSSTKRDPSHFEHVEKNMSKLKSDNKRKSSKKEECIPPEIPHYIIPYIDEYTNVSADGNCGYRSVAHQIYGSQDQWRRVRTELYDFIEQRLDFWIKIWHMSKDEAWITLRNVKYCESPCPYRYWMSMDEMGPVIATMYNVILVALDPIQMGTLTYLPLYIPEGIIGPEKLIGIAFLRSCNHFTAVALMDNCPIPEIYRFWFKFHEISVDGWDVPLYSRVEKWKSLRG